MDIPRWKKILVMVVYALLFCNILTNTYFLVWYVFEPFWYNLWLILIQQLCFFSIIMYLLKTRIEKFTLWGIAVLSVFVFFSLAFSGWGFQPVIAWVSMLWIILLLQNLNVVSLHDRIYLAFFSILPLTHLWELPFLFVNSGETMFLTFQKQGWITVFVYPLPRLLCFPFLFYHLKTLGWHIKRWMLPLTIVYLLWYFFSPSLLFEGISWFARLPTVAYSVAMIFGGLR